MVRIPAGLLIFLLAFGGHAIGAGDGFVEVLKPSEEVSAPPGKQATEHKRKGVTGDREDQSQGKRWLLAVGVSKFADTRVAPLAYSTRDAESFAAYLREDNVPAARLRLLLDAGATRAGILGALQDVKQRIGAEDTLFFFYSSHGVGDAQGRTHFITFDSVLDRLADTALPMQQIKEMVETIACRNIVMLVDSCHSGGAKSLRQQDEAAYDRVVRAATQTTRVAVLTSSRTHEISLESPEWGHGVFTYYLLDGLAGAADDFPRDGQVTVTELFDYLIVAVPRATDRAQHPTGRFSYNWPRKKGDSVAFGRAKGEVKPPKGAAPSKREGAWDTLLDDHQ